MAGEYRYVRGAWGPQPTVRGSFSLRVLFERISEGIQLVERLERALEHSAEHANTLLPQAETAYFEVLRDVCALSEDEADLVEPALTELELRLLPIFRDLY